LRHPPRRTSGRKRFCVIVDVLPATTIVVPVRIFGLPV
jgi:hypothetical protein